MFDTHAIARALAGAALTPAQMDAIADAVRQAAEHDHDSIDIDALATKTDLAALEARIYRAMLVQAGAIVGAVIGILRFLG